MTSSPDRRNKPRLRTGLAAAFAVAALAVAVGPAAAATTPLSSTGTATVTVTTTTPKVTGITVVSITAPVKLKPPITTMKVSW
ncbi:MAG: hypothetical protein IT200_01700 [Thermoleophilia bacterium]|nr:hypothetical protein [Thermoleophilia bacterium]